MSGSHGSEANIMREVKSIAAKRDALARKIAELVFEFETSTGMQVDSMQPQRAAGSTPLGRKYRRLSINITVRLGDPTAPPTRLVLHDEAAEEAP